MMDMTSLEAALSDLPLYEYFEFTTDELTFSDRIRWICEHECPMYGKSWACPPGTGSVAECEGKCLSYPNALLISTVTEVRDISNIEETLAARPEHEAVTNEVRDLMRSQGVEPYVLSTEACAICDRCAYLDGKPCRFPEKMHPCIESHGINIIPTLEENGLDIYYGTNIITWYSLLFFND